MRQFAERATAVAALVIVPTTLVLIFESVEMTPYIVEFLIGGGVPFLTAGSCIGTSQ